MSCYRWYTLLEYELFVVTIANYCCGLNQSETITQNSMLFNLHVDAVKHIASNAMADPEQLPQTVYGRKLSRRFIKFIELTYVI